MTKYGILITILTYSVTFLTLDSRVSKWYNPQCHRFYQERHYTHNFRAKGVHKALSSIPGDASVSAMSPLVPHLACRDKIYCFPAVNDAGYIVLFRQYATYYPLSEEEYRNKISEVESMGYWVKLVDDNNLLTYKKGIAPTTIDKKNEFSK